MVKNIKLGEEYGKMVEGGVMYEALEKMAFIYIYIWFKSNWVFVIKPNSNGLECKLNIERGWV